MQTNIPNAGKTRARRGPSFRPDLLDSLRNKRGHVRIKALGIVFISHPGTIRQLCLQSHRAINRHNRASNPSGKPVQF
jgi:hypothetical protein